MKFGKELIITAALFIAVIAGMLCAAQAMDCTAAAFEALGLTDIQFGKPVTNLSAAIVPAVAPLPQYCDVKGTIWPEIVFEVQLPTTWNQRFFMTGAGGAGGYILTSAMSDFLKNGFATAASNRGHPGDGRDWSWAYPGSDNPNADQRLIDHAYRANHETAVMAKKIIKAYYGSDARYSYWAGCSGGGSQGMKEAQRFPGDFDGLLIGAPGMNLTGTYALYANWVLQALSGDGKVSVEKLPILTSAIYSKCDSRDGLVDGLIDDPSLCKFDSLKNLPKCPEGVDGPACFTIRQVEALQKIYGGSKNSAGEQLYWGAALGSEQFWSGILIGPEPHNLRLSRGYLQYVAFYPNAPGPTYNWKTFNFDTDPGRMAAAAALVNATDTDLSVFKQRGGKIIYYHGLADPNITPYSSVQYYKDVAELLGKEKTKEFYKLYLIPGMAHCTGGIGSIDSVRDLSGTLLPALIDWVEKGIDPAAFVGHRVVNGQVVRTRPICPYPEVARYGGRGSIDEAKNFTCVNIIPAEVKIEPKPVNLRRKGDFAASITIPEGYDVKNFDAVACEGASAVRGTFTKRGSAYKARFNRQDLIKITAGDAVTFTVTSIFEHNGQKYAFEGSDYVKVIE